MASSICIGVAGGTGSGKTTVAEAIINKVGHGILAMTQDRYYLDLLTSRFEQILAAQVSKPRK